MKERQFAFEFMLNLLNLLFVVLATERVVAIVWAIHQYAGSNFPPVTLNAYMMGALGLYTIVQLPIAFLLAREIPEGVGIRRIMLESLSFVLLQVTLMLMILLMSGKATAVFRIF